MNQPSPSLTPPNVLRHPAPQPDDRVSESDPATRLAMIAHIEKNVGRVHGVFSERRSAYIHSEVFYVAPTKKRPYYTLFTVGMSDRPMTVPKGAEEVQYSELMLCLPPDWDFTTRMAVDDNWYWPVNELSNLARFPHEFGTWLSWGHTVPNGDPPKEFASRTKMCGTLLLEPKRFPERIQEVKVSDEKTVSIWSVIPLYAEEMTMAREAGAEYLIHCLEEARVDEILNPQRPLVMRRKM